MPFDPDELKMRAVRETGLDSFGEAPLDTSLGIFCASLAEEGRLTPEGVAKAEELITGHLAERLRLENFIARHAEVLDQNVSPGCFLVGMPRSGTTALAQHLSEDPALRSIPRWEAASLTPPETGAQGNADPRIAASKAAFEAAFKAMPWRQKILPNTYDDPAEHGVLMALTFLSLHWPTLYRVPRWTSWVLQQDLTPGYEYLARTLKVLQWARPARRWSLKLPPDLFALDAIAKVFPDAVFVWAHRNPVESISSVASLCAQLREKQCGAQVDAAEVGRQQLEFQAIGVDRAMAARDAIGEDRFADVWQADLGRDLVGTITALYARLGMDVTPAYLANLEARVREKPRGRFGKHEHELARFGLDEQAVTARFARYIERFHR